MPELPDITVYLEALAPRVIGEKIESVVIRSPFLVRSVDPPVEAAVGKRVAALERIGKRIVLALEDDLFIVLHLMVAGRLRWRPPGAAPKGRMQLATFGFAKGTLLLTEAGTRKQASLHIVRGRAALAELDPGGLEVLEATLEEFGQRLRSGNHTLKRALTDPRLLSGIGNSYSDEILHRARLSPVKLTSRLDAAEVERLFVAAREVLVGWTDRLRREVGDGFPEKVTAFRPGMAAHGRYREPCPACGSPIQRIVYARNETNYCAECQTGGKLLADRALSRLLRKDWPRTLAELEERRRGAAD
jgi:formamidopyrimidine-DNA glycosylase